MPWWGAVLLRVEQDLRKREFVIQSSCQPAQALFQIDSGEVVSSALAGEEMLSHQIEANK